MWQLAFIKDIKPFQILRTKTALGLVFLLLFSFIQHGFSDDKVAVIETKFGNMVIEFFPEDAPKTVDNFIKLAESGFYDGTKFHRIIKDFAIQGGDPISKDSRRIQEWGTGGANYTIKAEFNDIKHKRGIISMARMADPDSASSQFFIVQKDSPSLDKKYTVFGRLITQESYGVLDSIASLDTVQNENTNIPVDIPLNYADAEIKSIKIKNRSEISNILSMSEPERIISHYKIDEQGNYLNTLYGFSFHVPEGWLVQEPEKTQPKTPDVAVVGPIIDGFPSYISFLVLNSNGTTLENYISDTRKVLQPFIDEKKLEITSSHNTDFKKNKAYDTFGNYSFATQNKIFELKFHEILIENNGKFYIITYTNQEKNFEPNLKTFNDVLDSFQFSSKSQEEPQIYAYAGIGIGIAIAAVVAVIILTKKKNLKQKTNS